MKNLVDKMKLTAKNGSDALIPTPDPPQRPKKTWKVNPKWVLSFALLYLFYSSISELDPGKSLGRYLVEFAWLVGVLPYMILRSAVGLVSRIANQPLVPLNPADSMANAAFMGLVIILITIAYLKKRRP